ncbi:acetyltransferase (GNAT) family protein [Haloactinopolyspora alba]|uniref:Acetyltransferase (GNAT) family protein n=1 Tax=Haloactinopolyspora alba TaxID=648780 RepID=A0A2P8DR85_9ACTN|nr:GNAT family N-acetyltransferase [Haloactinopolyspora alba]PSK99732.1 acetyltransferase (GNAT) family protein [Haloactinopolyspora alba]
MSSAPTADRDETGLFVRALRYSDPVVRALETELQQEYVERYGDPDDSPVEPDEFAPPHGRFLVGFVGNEPVATGGFRRHDDDVAEIKRMYVSHDHRGDGHARRLLAELEARAAEAGYRRVILETGTRQPEAMTLYSSSGYAPTAPFGHYADADLSRFFAKELDAPAEAAEHSEASGD